MKEQLNTPFGGKTTCKILRIEIQGLANLLVSTSGISSCIGDEVGSPLEILCIVLLPPFNSVIESAFSLSHATGAWGLQYIVQRTLRKTSRNRTRDIIGPDSRLQARTIRVIE
jgi:hypothetical protein